MGEVATRSPGSVGRKTRRAEDVFSTVDLPRAGFEPFRARGIRVGVRKFASSVISDI
jgi:hypothetical protein